MDRSGDIQQASAQDAQDELMNLLTIMYIAVQETLNDPEEMSPTYGKLRMYRQIFAALILASVANKR